MFDYIGGSPLFRWTNLLDFHQVGATYKVLAYPDQANQVVTHTAHAASSTEDNSI